MTRRIVWGLALASPFAFLLLPEPISDAINGTIFLVTAIVAVVTFTLTGVLAVVKWWHDRTSVDKTLDEMGYANTRNARQWMGGRHGKP